MALVATCFVDVFVVWTNDDLTEGRGREYPMAVCELEATANRLAKGSYVMGSDARITKEVAYYINDRWYFIGTFTPATPEDRIENVKILEMEKKKLKAADALEKAKRLGLSDDDIFALKNGML